MAVNCDLSVSYYNKNKYTKFFNKQNYYLKKKINQSKITHYM